MSFNYTYIDYPAIAGCKCISEWHIRYMANFIWEIPTQIVMPLLPAGLYPIEPRPGVSLLDIGHVVWKEGNLKGQWEAFEEVTVLILVQPDLSYDAPVPKFAFFALKIAANYLPFVIYERQTIHLPTWQTSLSHTYASQSYWVDVKDNTGPICLLKNSEPSPIYHPDKFICQFYAFEDNQLWLGFMEWEGELAEHQHTGNAGQLYNHPIFDDMDVEKYAKTCYLQLFTKANVSCIERFFEPMLIG